MIYVITNNVNGKQYVGQTVSFLSSGRKWGSHRRWQAHVKCAKAKRFECRLLESAISKYGKEEFKVEDVLECKIEELNSFEKEYIDKYNSLAPNGYNLMTGGGNGRKHSVDTKERMSNTRTGKIHSKITKERIAKSNKGLIVEEEGRKNIGKASKYRNMSTENRDRLQSALDIVGIEHLPMYICLSVKRGIDTIIVRMPQTAQKSFGKKNMPLSVKIQKAIEYKNSLIRNGHRSEGSSQPQ